MQSFAVFFLMLALSAQASMGQSGSWAILENSPVAQEHGRLDDVIFVSEDVGWVVDTAGRIWKTSDAGANWTLQFDSNVDFPTKEPFRSVGFVDEKVGFVGSLGRSSQNPRFENLLFETRDGGETWTDITGKISGDLPGGICGIWVVDDEVAYAVGRYGLGPSGILKTIDGGATWTSRRMTDIASVLIDVYFFDRDTGIMIGSTAPEDGELDDWTDLETVRGAVFMTKDGGETWEMKHAVELTQSWGWKISFPSREVGYVAIQGGEAIVLKTSDGGETWTEKPIPSGSGLSAIGFVNERVGWAGGSTSYLTIDGGETWSPGDVGVRINRIRILDEHLAYATGRRIYKYTAEAVAKEVESPFPTVFTLHQNYPNPFNPSTQITFDVPKASVVRLEVFDVMGRSAEVLLDAPLLQGSHVVTWRADDFSSGVYVVRLDAGTHVLSHTVVLAK